MAYAIAWNEAAPVGASVNASTIDTEFQNFKKSVRERMNDILSNLWETDGNNPKLLDPTALVMDKCVLKLGSVFSVPNNALTAITWDSEIKDTNSMFDAGSPTIVTIKTTGFYMIILQTSFAANATGQRRAAIVLSGSTVAPLEQTDASAAGITSHNAVIAHDMTLNDTVTFQAFQDSGGARNLSANSTYAMVVQII